MAGIRRLTSSSIPALEGKTPEEHVQGLTRDITTYCLFDWYDTVYYHDPIADFPYQTRKVGKFLGVAENSTDELAYVILPKSGIPLTRKSVWAIPPETLKTNSVVADVLELDTAINGKLASKDKGAVRAGIEEYEYFPEAPSDIFDGDESDPIEFTDHSDLKDADDYTPAEMDEFLSAELLLPHGDKMSE